MHSYMYRHMSRVWADLLQGLASLVDVMSDAVDGSCVEEHDGTGTAQALRELVDLGPWEWDTTKWSTEINK